jgi:hypothetical protein
MPKSNLRLTHHYFKSAKRRPIHQARICRKLCPSLWNRHSHAPNSWHQSHPSQWRSLLPSSIAIPCLSHRAADATWSVRWGPLGTIAGSVSHHTNTGNTGSLPIAVLVAHPTALPCASASVSPPLGDLNSPSGHGHCCAVRPSAAQTAPMASYPPCASAGVCHR